MMLDINEDPIKQAVALLEREGYTVQAPDGVKYGCHVELFATISGQPDDTCVIDEGCPNSCIYASGIRCKEECKYWLRITPASIRAQGGKVE